MKPVESHVLSSDPISLSDATSFLSAFNNSVCGGGGAPSVAASHETCWFVRRALASFKELDQLHHKHRGPKSDRSRRQESQNDDFEITNPPQSFMSSRDVTSKPRSHRNDDVTEPKVEAEGESKGGSRNMKNDGGEVSEVDEKIKKKKKKKKKKKEEKKVKGNVGNVDEDGDGESEMRNEEVKKEEKKKKKKKRDNVDENEGGIKEEDVESKMGSAEAKKEEKKKRKSEVLENREVDASGEKQEKSKKRRKR